MESNGVSVCVYNINRYKVYSIILRPSIMINEYIILRILKLHHRKALFWEILINWERKLGTEKIFDHKDFHVTPKKLPFTGFFWFWHQPIVILLNKATHFSPVGEHYDIMRDSTIVQYLTCGIALVHYLTCGVTL